MRLAALVTVVMVVPGIAAQPLPLLAKQVSAPLVKLLVAHRQVVVLTVTVVLVPALVMVLVPAQVRALGVRALVIVVMGALVLHLLLVMVLVMVLAMVLVLLLLSPPRSMGAPIAHSPSASGASLPNWCRTPNGAGWPMPNSVRAWRCSPRTRRGIAPWRAS
jgi:hypothetical protein